MCCASCGIAEIDDIKLVPCDGCDLVKYCSDACQELHRPEHAGKCRKRAAELRDELLFKRPESTHKGDCPICCLPLSVDPLKSSLNACCSKIICHGCAIANQRRESQHTCPFCREAVPQTKKECEKLNIKRAEANDPVAIFQLGAEEYKKKDYRSAIEYYTRAAELGIAEAHYEISHMYLEGQGVEKERGKEIHHLEEAAIGGHPYARFRLGVHEGGDGNIERAVKHWIIASTQGCDKSIKILMDFFKEGFVRKEVLDAALRAHKAAVDATKSPQRKAAEEFFRDNNLLDAMYDTLIKY